MDYPTPEEIAAGVGDELKPVESIVEFQRICQNIRRMLRSAELRAARLYTEDVEEYNDLANGIWTVHDELQNTQYEDY